MYSRCKLSCPSSQVFVAAGPDDINSVPSSATRGPRMVHGFHFCKIFTEHFLDNMDTLGCIDIEHNVWCDNTVEALALNWLVAGKNPYRNHKMFGSGCKFPTERDSVSGISLHRPLSNKTWYFDSRSPLCDIFLDYLLVLCRGQVWTNLRDLYSRVHASWRNLTVKVVWCVRSAKGARRSKTHIYDHIWHMQ